ncbi:unnamed protein product, partial [Ectocarpus sp. 4 AP-2014]
MNKREVLLPSAVASGPAPVMVRDVPSRTLIGSVTKTSPSHCTLTSPPSTHSRALARLVASSVLLTAKELILEEVVMMQSSTTWVRATTARRPTHTICRRIICVGERDGFAVDSSIPRVTTHLEFEDQLRFHSHVDHGRMNMIRRI